MMIFGEFRRVGLRPVNGAPGQLPGRIGKHQSRLPKALRRGLAQQLHLSRIRFSRSVLIYG